MSAFTQLINDGSTLLHGQAGRDLMLLPTGTGANAQLDGAEIPCRALVNMQGKTPTMDQNGNYRMALTGRVSLTRANNLALVEQLAALQIDRIPESWRVRLDGKVCKIRGSYCDETAWEFDLMEAI